MFPIHKQKLIASVLKKLELPIILEWNSYRLI